MQKIRTAENRMAFLSTLAETANARESCKRVGIGRMTVYQWREDDPSFAEGWDKAVSSAPQRRRTKQSAAREVRRYSDTLLIFMLKARKPDVYRERASIEHTGANSGPHAVQFYLPTNGRGDQTE